MKAIVTGGAGFIGSHLAERLIKDGHEVIVLDNLSTGRLDNLEEVKTNNKFSFYNVDISKFDTIHKHFKGVDWVFHLAALADIVPSIDEPLKYHASNVDGTIAVLEASRLGGVKKFIYTASSSCYGIAQNYPTQEVADISPQYPYAFTKYIGERYTFHWAQVYKLKIASLRLFNVYGPRSRTSGTYGAVFGVFLAQKLHGAPFTVVGDGTQRRDFIYVTDVAAAFLSAAQSDISGEVFNIGSSQPQSINTLVSLLGGEIAYIPKRPGEPDCTWADITKIKSMLGWQPVVSFQEGVRLMLDNIDYWKEAPLWTPEKIESATKKWFKYLS
ncbi:MAG: SDR family oxidoreductase [Candidatus Omnitrophica bacterium]|nr:SDR family oxidoreductase [Candidatus Omnitrophota bacterium]